MKIIKKFSKNSYLILFLLTFFALSCEKDKGMFIDPIMAMDDGSREIIGPFKPDTCQTIYGLLDFDGVNDLVNLDSAPEMRYKKYVTFNCYLSADSGFDNATGNYFFALGATAYDKLFVGLRDNYLYICPGSSPAYVVSYDITGLANKILTIQIIKEDFAGLGKVLNLIINDENKPIANPGGYGIVNGDGDLIGALTETSGFLKNALIWDIEIWDMYQEKIHFWKGHPRGDSEISWIDLGSGGIDGQDWGGPSERDLVVCSKTTPRFRHNPPRHNNPNNPGRGHLRNHGKKY